MPPRLTVYARRRFVLQMEVGHPQCVDVVDMVQERGEPHRLIGFCCLTYPLEHTEHTFPALSPACVLPRRFPLARPRPSIASADARASLFGNFAGTMGLSDFPCPFIVGVRLPTSRHGPYATH